MLSLTFHRTFIPERRLIASLLEYTALGKSGGLKDISRDTGIPMGESTGKVSAIVDYACAMGLVDLPNRDRSMVAMRLTPLGQIVYLEDRYLGERLTQWLVHSGICRRDRGARAWYEVFARGRTGLGSSFTRQQVEEYLINMCGPGHNRTGPLLSTYMDDAALGRSGVLAMHGERIERNKAPLLDGYWTAYSAYVLSLMDAFFPGQRQVTFTDLNAETLWFDICLWTKPDLERAFMEMERKGFISIDRQMEPWVVERRTTADQVWSRIFDDAV